MDKPVPVATLPDDSFGDVVVGRKIACFGNDLRPLRSQRHCRGHYLEQVHRGAICGDDAVGLCADQRRDPGAHLAG